MAGLGLGMQVAARAGVAPFVLAVRMLAGRRTSAEAVPEPKWDLEQISKAVLDEVFFLTELVTMELSAFFDHRRLAEEASRAVELYGDSGWLEDPARFHCEPPPIRDAVLSDEFRLPWGPYRHLRFESGYEPHAGEPGRERWLNREANRTAHAWLLEHPGEPRPWLLCVPGYRMGSPVIDFTGFRVHWLHRGLGLNLAIPVLPLHGPRRCGWRGGDGFLTGDFVDTIHAQAQAVWDIRRLVGWLRGRGAPAIGAYGVSLGGYTAALLSAFEEFECVIAGVPAVDFLRLFRKQTPRCLERAVEWMGFPLEKIARMLRVISPLALSPRVRRERRYLYAGLADRVVTPDHAYDLWEHWERPRIEWYPGGHISFLWERNVAGLLAEALHESGLASRPRVAAPEAGVATANGIA